MKHLDLHFKLKYEGTHGSFSGRMVRALLDTARRQSAAIHLMQSIAPDGKPTRVFTRCPSPS
jgi:hypothetical protein